LGTEDDAFPATVAVRSDLPCHDLDLISIVREEFFPLALWVQAPQLSVAEAHVQMLGARLNATEPAPSVNSLAESLNDAKSSGLNMASVVLLVAACPGLTSCSITTPILSCTTPNL
jgi:hypothetical protein